MENHALPALRLSNLWIDYGTESVVKNCHFSLHQGSIGALLGASGSGKSTLLKAIAGLLPIRAGEIVLQGRIVSDKQTHLAPQQRDVGMLFQDYALFAHLNTLENVLFGLRHLPKAQARTKALEMLERVQLQDFNQRYPHQLSGGQQQRVALARALVRDPSLLLLDEPFSNLDQAVREHLIDDLRQLFKAQHISALLVTHNKHEAFALADSVALMEEGTIVQSAAPKALYDQTASQHLARFLGHISIWKGIRAGNAVQHEIATLPLPPQAQTLAEGSSVECHLRPHQYRLIANPNGIARISHQRFLGDVSLNIVQLPSGQQLELMSIERFSLDERIDIQLYLNT